MAGEYVWSGGQEAPKKSVPSIGGSAEVAGGGHTDDGSRAQGVAYDTNASVGEKLDTSAYPGGSVFPEGHINF